MATKCLDVGEVLRLPAKAFRKWEIYDEVEPFGEWRADVRAAQIVAMIANVNRGKNQKAYKIEDFLLKFIEAVATKPSSATAPGVPQRTQTQREQVNILMLWARAQAAQVAEEARAKGGA